MATKIKCAKFTSSSDLRRASSVNYHHRTIITTISRISGASRSLASSVLALVDRFAQPYRRKCRMEPDHFGASAEFDDTISTTLVDNFQRVAGDA